MSLAEIQSNKALKLAKQNGLTLNNVSNRITPNVFDITSASKGFWNGSIGGTVIFNPSSSWFSSPVPISVKAGDTINVNLAYQSFYIGVDDTGKVVQTVGSVNPVASRNFTVITGVTKIYFNAYITYANNFMATINKSMPTFFMSGNGLPISKWFGKSYAMLGDSITWQDGNAYNNGSYPSNTGQIAIGYGSLLKNKTGLSTVANYGISGASMGKSSAYPSSGCISLDGQGRSFANFDLVTIFAGTNDFKLNVAIGNQGLIGDTTFDNTTFYGAYRQLIEYLLTQKPTLKIMLFTPLQRNNGGYDVNFTNSTGAKLIDYRNAIINIGIMYGIPVLDLYSVSSITAKTLSTFLMDGLHPHDLGYTRISEVICPFVENH